MHPVKRLHLVGVFCNQRIPLNISNGNFTERIDGKYHNLKNGIKRNQPQYKFHLFRKPVFCKKYGEDQKTDQHDIDADKINAGHDGHTEIAVVQDTDKITDIYDCCYKTGVAQIFPDDIFFLDRFMKQNNINDCNQDGNNNVTVQKHLMHNSSPFPQELRYLPILIVYKKNKKKSMYMKIFRDDIPYYMIQ